jgi:hypothetical protein
MALKNRYDSKINIRNYEFLILDYPAPQSWRKVGKAAAQLCILS